jgi:RNA polymerase sigma-70 factor, ECF subfamily
MLCTLRLSLDPPPMGNMSTTACGEAWLASALSRYAVLQMRDASTPDAHARRRDDLRMVRRVLQGDVRAQSQLIELLTPHLRVVARSIMSRGCDVDDAIQAALMRVLEGLDGYRAEASLVRWSRRIAAHACLRMREQEQRRLRVIELDEDPEERVSPALVSRDGVLDELPRPVAAYLDELPEVQREVLVLRHVLDHTVAEIAALVDAPLDTVKSRLLYARRALRKLIRRDRLMTNVKPRREVVR